MMAGNETANRRQDSGPSEALSMSYEESDLHPSHPHRPSRLPSGDLNRIASITPQVQSSMLTGSGIPPHTLMNAVDVTTNTEGDVTETPDQIDETLVTALRSPSYNSLGSSRNFLEELTLLLEDDEDGWSDDELCGIQEWLAALGFGEGWQVDADPSSLSSLSLEPSLSKAVIRSLPKEVFHTNQSGNNTKVGSSLDEPKQEECSVCLEAFLTGQILTCLPCNHRFHEDCVTPWLENHAHCPYCRTKVIVGGGTSSTRSNEERNSQAFPLNHEDVIAWMEAVDSGLIQMGIR